MTETKPDPAAARAPDQGGEARYRVRLVPAMARIDPAHWDACAGSDNPFVSHAFLMALEQSGSVCPETGWLPQHLLLEDRAGTLVGCVPLYLKSHSQGEYVFDHAWARAYEQAGRAYYPKLQAAVPFSPVPGPRLLCRPDAPDDVLSALAQGLMAATAHHEASSVHVTFLPESDWATLGSLGFLQRIGVQFHWENRDYQNFDGFLADLNARKRKSIRKERAGATAQGLAIHTLTGSEITARHWDAFYEFYCATVDKKWGSAYLTRGFFDLLGANLGDKIVLVMAERDDTLIAGALNLRGRDTLYGRNWGCLEEAKFLHFELCYYQAIDYAIRHGLKRVEAGAQGMHKIQRGYLPTLTYSAHYLPDPSFHRAVARFLDQERAAIAAEMQELSALSPFRQDGP